MPRPSTVPRQLHFLPFRGTTAVTEGLLTRGMLQGPAWVRLLPDVYLHRDARLDYRLAVSYSTLLGGDVTRFAGIPLTTPVRTAFDLGRRPPLPEAVVAVDALLHRLLQLDELQAYAAAHRWAGSRQLAGVLALAEPLTESPMETRLRLIVVEAGLPRPIARHEVYDSTGRFLARLDLAYPALRLGLEYEGDHHRDRATFRHDLARINALRVAGWTVLRFTADDVLRHPGRIVHQVATLLGDRSRLPNATQVKAAG